jgi:hypothetical protein
MTDQATQTPFSDCKKEMITEEMQKPCHLCNRPMALLADILKVQKLNYEKFGLKNFPRTEDYVVAKTTPCCSHFSCGCHHEGNPNFIQMCPFCDRPNAADELLESLHLHNECLIWEMYPCDGCLVCPRKRRHIPARNNKKWAIFSWVRLFLTRKISFSQLNPEIKQIINFFFNENKLDWYTPENYEFCSLNKHQNDFYEFFGNFLDDLKVLTLDETFEIYHNPHEVRLRRWNARKIMFLIRTRTDIKNLIITDAPGAIRADLLMGLLNNNDLFKFLISFL